MRTRDEIEDGVGVIDERISSTIEDQLHTVSPATPAMYPSSTAKRPSLLQRLLSDRELRRVIAFLFAGGVSAIITITVTKLFHDIVLADVAAQLRFLLAAVIGTEIGILVNFAINDQLAFRDLSGHRRPVHIRILRFHVTCATGQTLILLISWMLHDIAGLGTVIAQALPIVFVTGINFALHRFWTYRAIKKA